MADEEDVETMAQLAGDIARAMRKLDPGVSKPVEDWDALWARFPLEFALPAHLSEKVAGTLLKMPGFDRVLGGDVVEVEAFQVAATSYAYFTRQEARAAFERALDALEADLDFVRFIPCRFLLSEIPLFVLEGDGAEVELVDDTGANLAMASRFTVPYQAYRPMLEDLGRWYGIKRFRLHSGGLDARPIEPPTPEPDVIDVYPNVCPQGDHDGRVMRRQAAGVPINKEFTEVECATPAKGRGVTLEDGTKQVVAQVIDRTIFLMFPIFKTYNELGSFKLFRNGMAAGLRGVRILEGKEAYEPEVITGSKDVALWATTVWIDGLVQRQRQHVKELTAQVADLEKALMRVRRDLADNAAIARAMARAPHIAEARRRILEDLRRIEKLPEVESVIYTHDGLHVATREIVAEWQGRRYRLGRYVIRFAEYGLPSFWCLDSPHPDRATHPHTNLDGSPCVGNARSALLEMMTDFRLFDAVSLFLSWLARSYTPSDALVHKMEEWPDIGPIEARALPEPTDPGEPRMGGNGLNHSQHALIYVPSDDHRVTVIGAGAVGSEVVRMLAQAGVPHVTVWDDDVVSSHNLPMSWYGMADVGRPKVEALRDRVKREYGIGIEIVKARYMGEPLKDSVVTAVDLMDTRRRIWCAVLDSRLVDIVIDPRVAGEQFEAFAVNPWRLDDAEFYRASLHVQSKVHPHTCGTHGLSHVSGMVAGAVCGNLFRWWMHGRKERHCKMYVGRLDVESGFRPPDVAATQEPPPQERSTG